MLATGVVNHSKKAAMAIQFTVAKYLTICLIHPLIRPPVPTMLIKGLMAQRQQKWYSHHSMYLKWMNPNLHPNLFSKNNTAVMTVALSLLQVWFGRFLPQLTDRPSEFVV